MIVNKYNTFLLESILLESVVRFSKDFNKVLSMIDDPIADKLKSIESKDLEVNSNFIGINKDNSELLKFLPNKRANELISELKDKVIFNNKAPLLRVNNYTKVLFDDLCFEPKAELEFGLYVPEVGEVGKLLSTDYKMFNGDEYALVEFKRVGVYSTRSLDDYTNLIFDSDNMQDIRIGRLIRGLLSVNKDTFTDRELELFVDKFRASADKVSNGFVYIDIVKGDKIHEYYQSNKHTTSGSLGTSCMRDSDESTLELYTSSDNVGLMIYINPNDETKILARALIWTDINGDRYIDDIYYTKTHNCKLLEDYCNKNNISVIDKIINVQLKAGVNFFPYLDTLNHYNYTTGMISNRRTKVLGVGYIFNVRDTDGGFSYASCSECDSGTDESCEFCHGKGEDFFEDFY